MSVVMVGSRKKLDLDFHFRVRGSERGIDVKFSPSCGCGQLRQLLQDIADEGEMDSRVISSIFSSQMRHRKAPYISGRR